VRFKVFILVFFTQLLAFGYAQNRPKSKLTKILFVFDASNSMKASFRGITRMEGAKQLFFKFIDSLSKDKSLSFALRMYGHTVKYPPGDCKDSKLVVPFSSNNIPLIKQKVKECKPTGITPIEHSLTQAANDFSDNKSNNIVILITDGIEECGGDPCKARQKLMEKGIIFKPFIIGIGLSPEQIKTFECVGNFFDIENNETFNTIANLIQQQKLNKTTAQVNLLNSMGLPSETNVNTTFIDINRKAYKYNYIHTLNALNNPDTLYIDDYPSYKVIAHTIPPVESKEVKLTIGKHTIIPIDAPQGFLSINRPAGVYNYNEKVKYVVRKQNDDNTLHVQALNTVEKYIVGTYKVEILTLPRIYINEIEIEQSKNKEINIPNAGMLTVKTLEPGDGCVMQKINGKNQWVCNLSNKTMQNFYLQPGNYVAVWRSKSLKGSIYTIEKQFIITSDVLQVIEFYK
jgi:Ca-activated chloride channel family protein